MPIDAAKIRQLREASLMTQVEGAQRAGLKGGRQQWNSIEAGRRRNVSADTLLALARALGVTMEELMIEDRRATRPARKAK